VAVVAGSLASGLHPLPTLSGTTISTGAALVLIGAQPARLPHPDPGHRAIGLLFSTVFRNSAAAVVGRSWPRCCCSSSASCPGSARCSPTC
jgi:ABC-2 type transport system permease protein